MVFVGNSYESQNLRTLKLNFLYTEIDESIWILGRVDTL